MLPPGDRSPGAGPGRRESLGLLRQAGVGRLVHTVDALPTLTVTPYVLDAEDAVVMVAPPASPLRLLNGGVVGFEADRLSTPGVRGWSVVVIGQAQLVTYRDGVVHLGGAVAHPAPHPDTEAFLRIPADMVTGRWLDG